MKVFPAFDNIYSPLGKTTRENFQNMIEGKSSVKLIENRNICKNPAFLSIFDNEFENFGVMTKFEQICTLSIEDAISGSRIDTKDSGTQFILSTTKGNIGILDGSERNAVGYPRISLDSSAAVIANHFGFANDPLVISNACISGVVALIIGERMIKLGLCNNVIVTGADLLSEFIVSGFQTLKAIGSSPCKPFDLKRDGINLGECASTIILTNDEKKCGENEPVELCAGSFNSDANHISGPSRTAEGLYLSITRTLHNIEVKPDFISAHGTATSFNDETEAIGFDRAELNDIPVNSLKGYFGHTLGAAGVAETAISLCSMRKGIALKTKGFEELGVSREINVIRNNLIGNFNSCLKTASGFGGCNASLFLQKHHFKV